MKREEICKVIEKNLKESVDGIENEIFDTSKKFTQYGANSLDIVEIVSTSMRELKIKIPRTELSDIENIEGLVEKFIHYAK